MINVRDMGKALDEFRSLRKQLEQSQDELAAVHASSLLGQTAETNGRKIVVRVLSERDVNFVKLMAQKLTRLSSNAIALLATISPQPALVFAQSPGQPFDMGALMKEAMAKLGGGGGGSKDMAQGGVPKAEGIDAVLSTLAATLSDR